MAWLPNRGDGEGERFWKDRQGRVVIIQWPNWPLWAAVISYGVAWLASNPTVQSTALLCGRAFLLVWAGLEVWQGVNGFRRLLGAVVLTYVGWQLVGGG